MELVVKVKVDVAGLLCKGQQIRVQLPAVHRVNALQGFFQNNGRRRRRRRKKKKEEEVEEEEEEVSQRRSAPEKNEE